MHIAEVVTIAKSLPLLRLNTYKSLILSYSADYRRILTNKRRPFDIRNMAFCDSKGHLLKTYERLALSTGTVRTHGEDRSHIFNMMHFCFRITYSYNLTVLSEENKQYSIIQLDSQNIHGNKWCQYVNAGIQTSVNIVQT